MLFLDETMDFIEKRRHFLNFVYDDGAVVATGLVNVVWVSRETCERVARKEVEDVRVRKRFPDKRRLAALARSKKEAGLVF
jgi:hypothetical protein